MRKEWDNPCTVIGVTGVYSKPYINVCILHNFPFCTIFLKIILGAGSQSIFY